MAISVATLLMAFQNCSDFGAMSAATNSALCRAKVQPKPSFKATDLHCGDMGSYQCERRVFSPTALQNLSHSLIECVGSGSLCVEVEVREFNTEAARSGAGEGAFLPGGEYNREEIRCHHRGAQDGELAVLTGEGDSLDEALAHVMSACEQAGVGQ